MPSPALPALVAFVALQHLAFAVLEAVLWRRPIGRRLFGLTPEQADLMAPLALNQGLYNLFLAAGLVWGIAHPDPAVARSLQLFFLGCVAVAGVVGGLTVKPSIFLVQAVPALLGLALWVLV